MTGDYDALLRGVLIDPADDFPRLILADFLDENGQGDRAECIRLQIEVLRSLCLLGESYSPDWEFRGFVSEVRLPLAAFITHAEELFETHPIERVVLTDAPASPDTDTFWREGAHPFPSGSWCRYFLPVRIYDLLENVFVDYGDWKSYESPEAARDALSAACVSYGRKLAGLPELVRKEGVE